MAPGTIHSDLLGHPVRSDPWAEQGRSSYALAFAALELGEFARAHEYGDLTVQEASEAYELYALWLRIIPKMLSDNGISELTLRKVSTRIIRAIGHPDLDSGWADYQALIARFGEACRDGAAGSARSLLADARRTWQHHHDRACDTICALFDIAATHLGEAFVGTLWDGLLSGMYDRAAQIYDPTNTPWKRAVERLFLDIAEATRGHLTGPRRDGEFAIVEETDRWVITFAPCGSGGRTFAGPAPSVTTQRHDWAWNTTGVCLYCAHCCQLQQRAPIARLGFPLRVIDPPVQGRTAVCTWSIYKDPELTPDAAYTSVGFDPPDRIC